jgi:hypothetical protein
LEKEKEKSEKKWTKRLQLDMVTAGENMKRIIPALLISSVLLFSCSKGAEQPSSVSSENSVSSSDSETLSPSDSSSSETVSTSDQPLGQQSLGPNDFEIGTTGYPADATKTIGSIEVFVSKTQKNSVLPLNAAGTKLAKVDTIQMQALTGTLYNTKAFPVKTVKIVQYDTTTKTSSSVSWANTAYADPHLFYGDAEHPLENKVDGVAVAGFDSTGAAIITTTYTLTKAYAYWTLWNDSDSEGSSSGRAFKGSLISINPE